MSCCENLSTFPICTLYISGRGHTDEDAASVRTSISVPSKCGLFYFEVTIDSKGRDGYIGDNLSGACPILRSVFFGRSSFVLLCDLNLHFPIRSEAWLVYDIAAANGPAVGLGFCVSDNKADRLPGWDPGSWGYHGDDGNAFGGTGKGFSYGPCFTAGESQTKACFPTSTIFRHERVSFGHRTPPSSYMTSSFPLLMTFFSFPM